MAYLNPATLEILWQFPDAAPEKSLSSTNADSPKVNRKQRDKAGRGVSRTAGDLAFGDVSIRLLPHSGQLSAMLFHVRDTRPITAYGRLF